MDSDRNSTTRLLWIDALRGYAITDVIGDHLHDAGIVGGCGVQLFFLVSAYSLLHSARQQPHSVGSFYLRRLFRIAPMFWLSIPLFAALRYATAGEHHNLTDLFAAISFLFWVPSQWKDAMVPGSWSISCEVLFYAVFPLLLLTVDNFRKSLLALVLSTVLAAMAWPLLRLWAEHAGLIAPSTQNFFAFHFITTQLPCFVLGFCIYFAPRKLEMPFWPTAAGTVGLVLLIGCVVMRLNSGRYYFIYAGTFALIAYALSAGSWKFIAHKWIGELGLISYSAYFWHFFWISIIGRINLDAIWFAIVVVGLTLLCASITYRYVEKPGIRLGARLSAALRESGGRVRSPIEKPPRTLRQ